MATLTSGMIAAVMLENAVDTFESQEQLVPLVNMEEYDPATMQRSGNVVWRPVQQHTNLQDDWDLSGTEDGIIEEEFPSVLGLPKSAWIAQRADDMRTQVFWERQGQAAGKKQASALNSTIETAISVQGSNYYSSAVTSGYDFIANGQAMLNEKQMINNGRSYVLNDRDTLKFSADLAARQTVQGRPADTWTTGQIGSNVAGFDVYTGSYLSSQPGGAGTAATVTGDQSFAPEAGSVDAVSGAVTNVDWRSATIPVSASAGLNVGDKITMGVNSIGMDTKVDTGQLMTFTIVAIPDSTSITVYPKPIAFDDPALSDLEKQYARIDTQIAGTTVIERLNTAATAKNNIFFDKDAVEVIGGTIPANLFSEFKSAKSVSTTLANGLQMTLLYDGAVDTMQFRYRCFVWYGVTVCNPQACGSAHTETA